MAIQGLHYIADSIQEEKPKAAEIIKKNFYVDDCLDSEDTLEGVMEVKEQFTSIFESYGLNLRKWNSNAIELMTKETVEVQLHPEKACTALGMQWNTSTDQRSYKVTLKPNERLTKRTALSQIASLFDPLGFLAPIIMRAKLFMQRLWLGQFGWDDPLPNELLPEWQAIQTSLLLCAKIRIPRWTGYAKQNTHVSLHGFCDASEKAYTAGIYLRTVHENESVEVHLLTSKSKVAPLKPVSIPRLELCSAVLLARLMDKFLVVMKIPKIEVHAWTDSSVTLAWISTPPHMLKTFVSNRVAEIQQKIKPEHWRHVKSPLNPADCATRWNDTTEVFSLSKWWNGPSFLMEAPEKWPQTPSHMISNKKVVPEMRAKVMHQQEEPPFESILTRFSSLAELLKITARFMRWKKEHKKFRHFKIITPIELVKARSNWIKFVQKTHFAQEIRCLQNKQPLNTRSALLSLNPTLDEDNSHLTTLIIRAAHFRTLHGGLQQTLRLLRDEFWIVRGIMAVKRILKQCVTCFRDKCRPAKQQMADLLGPQVQPNRPFSHTGVDFAGYFEVKTSTRKNAGFVKCYVSLFICLTTKAMHLELVHDLSTRAFIAALRRFVARRGVPSDIYSDRGTNFIGASHELPELWYDEQTRESQSIQREMADQGITWHFNPVRASHFGGLWEAGVKSMKTHLHRVIKNTKLTYEEFSTVITQIEACLNSRPLCPLDDNPENYIALTPGHFLTGQALMAIPQPQACLSNANRLTRFQYLQKLVQEFWDIWSHEYLNRLQQRPKWKKEQPNLKIGKLVLIKEDTLPPAKWALGRITKAFPGKDNLVRSVEVKCKATTVIRPIHKLCLLPIMDNMST